MTTQLIASTLYEDWQVRRDRLATLPGSDKGHVATELRLLNYLLGRYRGQARTQQPARFPMPSELFVDRRAIVVYRHLGKGYLTEMRTWLEAEERVRKLVDHMASQAAVDDVHITGPLFDPAAMPPFDERLERIRGRLCETNPDARLVAIVELGRIGTLDDIGFLSDLLALPPQSDEDPFERHVLLTAMKKIITFYSVEYERGR
jgi:hypothetical protein